MVTRATKEPISQLNLKLKGYIMTIMSYIVRFLSLVKIIPGGKSKLLDRTALILWTLLSIALSVAFLIVNWAAIQLLLSLTTSVSIIFTLGSGYFLPCLNILAVCPALHYLVSNYPHVLTDTSLPSLQHSWLFLVETVLGFSAASLTTLGISIDSSFYFTVNLSAMTYGYSLMIISSLIIGICTSQIRTKIEQNALLLLTKDSVSKLLHEFQELKEGMSPLLFMVFSTKCITIIQLSSSLFSAYSQIEFVILVAYNMMDLFYLTTALHQTYGVFKAMTLNLRYLFFFFINKNILIKNLSRSQLFRNYKNQLNNTFGLI